MQIFIKKIISFFSCSGNLNNNVSTVDFVVVIHTTVAISTKLNIQEFRFFRVAFLFKEISDNNTSCVKQHTATIGVNGLFNRLQGTVIAP